MDIETLEKGAILLSQKHSLEITLKLCKAEYELLQSPKFEKMHPLDAVEVFKLDFPYGEFTELVTGLSKFYEWKEVLEMLRLCLSKLENKLSITEAAIKDL